MTEKKVPAAKTVAKEVPKTKQPQVEGAVKIVDGFEMQPVSSSQIESIGHKDTTMRVKFLSGATYEYEGVDAERFKTILSAESVGKTFNALVKSAPSMFPYKKL